MAYTFYVYISAKLLKKVEIEYISAGIYY